MAWSGGLGGCVNWWQGVVVWCGGKRWWHRVVTGGIVLRWWSGKVVGINGKGAMNGSGCGDISCTWQNRFLSARDSKLIRMH